VALARGSGPDALVTVGMGRPHVLEERVRRILANEGPSARSRRPLAALCVLGLAPFASLQLVQARPSAALSDLAAPALRFDTDVDVHSSPGGASEWVWRNRVGDQLEEFEVTTAPDGSTHRRWRVDGEERPLGPRETARLESILERERLAERR
jgi:hypothetical protein